MRTQLPERWCIKIDKDNYDVLYKYWLSIPKNWNRNEFKGYLINLPNDGSYMKWIDNPPSRFELITFEEFEYLVLNKNQTYEIF